MFGRNFFIYFALVFLVGCTNGYEQIIAREVDTLKKNYASRDNKVYEPTSDVSFINVAEGEDVYRYAKRNFPNHTIMGKTVRSGEITLDRAVSDFAKDLGADIVLKQHEFVRTANRSYTKTTPTITNSQVTIRSGNEVYSGSAVSVGRENTTSSSGVNLYHDTFYFLKSKQGEKLVHDKTIDDFKGLSASKEDKYTGTWESEYMIINVFSDGSRYLGFVNDYFGIPQMAESHKKGALLFIIDKKTLKGKQYKRKDSLTNFYSTYDISIHINQSGQLITGGGKLRFQTYDRIK